MLLHPEKGDSKNILFEYFPKSKSALFGFIAQKFGAACTFPEIKGV